MKYRGKLFVWLLVCLVMLMNIMPAYAQAYLDQEHRCVLVMDYYSEDTPIAGAEFEVYRVANVDADLLMTLSGDFAEAGIELNGLDNEAFERAARELYEYAEENALAPGWVPVTDENGRIKLQDLTVGVYLVVGRPAVMGDRVHYSLPQLIVLPQYDEVNAEWDYAVSIALKSISIGIDEELLDLTVEKKWIDQGFEEFRPYYITVHLLWNGKLYDSVYLSEENNWTYTWTDLLPIGEWTVEEEIPTDYVLEITRDGNTFILKNYHKDIPQTGQLWWPVPVLLALGLVLVVVGILINRGKRHEAK